MHEAKRRWKGRIMETLTVGSPFSSLKT